MPEQRDAGLPPSTSPGAQPSGEARPLRRNRDFVLLWTGQALSATGSSITTVVYPLLALAVTNSATLAGVVGFAGMAAAALVRLPAGVLADRYPLKPLMVVPDLVRAAVTLWIVIVLLAGHVTLAQLLVVAVVASACGAVFESAQTPCKHHIDCSARPPGTFAAPAEERPR